MSVLVWRDTALRQQTADAFLRQMNVPGEQVIPLQKLPVSQLG